MPLPSNQINPVGIYVGYPAIPIMSDTLNVKVTATGGTLLGSVFEVISEAGAFPTITGLRPALSNSTLTVLNDSGNYITATFTINTPLTVSEAFAVYVTAGITQVTPTTNNIYTGSGTPTYTGTITRGGLPFNYQNTTTCAQITFSGTNSDTSGPSNIALNSPVPVGSYGTTMTFANGPANTTNGHGAFILGDTYLFTVLASNTTLNADGTNGSGFIPSTAPSYYTDIIDRNFSLGRGGPPGLVTETASCKSSPPVSPSGYLYALAGTVSTVYPAGSTTRTVKNIQLLTGI